MTESEKKLVLEIAQKHLPDSEAMDDSEALNSFYEYMIELLFAWYW